MARTQPDLVAFAKAIADDTRQQIMTFVCCKWASVSEITEHVGVSQPTVSHHLAILLEAGLVERQEEGRITRYALDQAAVTVCCGRLMQAFAPGSEPNVALALD
jgi:ArsR family transcriptional regulator